MFDLLSPVFAAAGLAAAALPFVLHMLRRMPAARMPFSAVQFLRPTPPRQTRRSRIEHWPLMFVRVLALALIGLAFGRPFQRVATSVSAAADARNRVALLIDGSASMRRDGIRDAVIHEVRATIGELQENDVLSIAQFSRGVRTILSAAEFQRHDASARAALIEQFLETYQPDWLDTRTGAALLSAADDVTADLPGSGPVGTRRIVLITDFQRGSRLDELRAATWPAGVEVELRVVKSDIAGNAGLSLAEPGSDGQVRVHVTSAADSQATEFQLQPLDDSGSAIGPVIPVSVTAGQRQTIEIPATGAAPPVRTTPSGEPATAAAGTSVAGLDLQRDPHEFDNRVWFAPAMERIIRIACVGASDSNDPADMRYYLQRVVDGSDTEPMELVDTVSSAGVSRPVDDNIRLVIVTDVVPDALVPSIRDCLDRQGVLLVVLRSAEMASSISGLLPHPLQVRESEISDYAMLGRIDFTNPLFRSFSDIRFSDFSSIRFWRTRTISLDDSTDRNAPHGYTGIASFDSGAPAILETTTPRGGRIFLLASGWHPQDSQLALSTRFAPLMISLVRLAHPPAISQPVRTVGDEYPVATVLGSPHWRVRLPDGLEVASDASEQAPSEAGQKSLRLTMPGRYSIRADGANARDGENSTPLTVIAGLTASESRTEPLPIGQLQALGVSAELVSGSAAGATGSDRSRALVDLHASELESRQKLWRGFLLAGLACLMFESLVAAGIERRRRMGSGT